MMPRGLPSSPSPKYLLSASPHPLKISSIVYKRLGSRERVRRVVRALDLGDLDAVDDRTETEAGVVRLRLGAGHVLQEGLRGVAGVRR